MSARSGDPIAFDTGPGNALIDQWVAREGGVPFDADGAIASEGGVVQAVVERYLDNPFFEKSGPKSLDRSDFTLAEAEGLELADGARTLAAVSAEAILKSVEHLPAQPKLWIVCGGGRKNPHIVEDLRDGARKAGAEVILAEDAGLRGDFIEAEAWAYLAVRSLKGLPLTFPDDDGMQRGGERRGVGAALRAAVHPGILGADRSRGRAAAAALLLFAILGPECLGSAAFTCAPYGVRG